MSRACLQKAPRPFSWEKNSLFTKQCWGNQIFSCKRMKLDHYFTLYIKINPTWIDDLIIRAKILKKLLEENIGVYLYDLRFVNGFFGNGGRFDAKTMSLKEKIDK